jgi:hypothetical protein
VSSREIDQIRHVFVDLLPPTVEERTLYVSVEYKCMVHLCLCGCGHKVVTPLSPTGWSLTFDGKTVSIYPSVGNWNLPCQSHYWIRESRVEWARKWSPEQIKAGAARDSRLKEEYFVRNAGVTGASPESTDAHAEQSGGIWARLVRWVRRLLSPPPSLPPNAKH